MHARAAVSNHQGLRVGIIQPVIHKSTFSLVYIDPKNPTIIDRMIYGQKLLLRPFRIEDLERLHVYVNDVDVALPSGSLPLPVAVGAVVAGHEGPVAGYASDAVVFAIEAANRFIGTCALQHFDAVARTCEMRVIIADHAFWGRGFGREITALLLNYAFRQHNIHRIWLNVLGNNPRALRCFTICNFVEEGRLRQHIWSDGAYADLVFMGLLRSDWQTQQTTATAKVIEPELVAG